MTEKKNIDLFDLVLFIIERRKLLAYIFLASVVISYGFVYVFIKEQFEASAVIIPSDDDNTNGLPSMLKGLKSLPMGLGSTATKSSVNRYNTIIYSRTAMESLLDQFRLLEVYNIDSTIIDARERAIKQLKKNVITNETKDDAFEIVVRSPESRLSADMVNYIVRNLNETIIGLKVQKSRDNRIFLGQRVEEIYHDLYASEDSLRRFQERSGLYDLKSQVPEIVAMYAKIETEVMSKEIQRSILQRLYDTENPEVKSLNIQIAEYEKKLNKLRSQESSENILLGMKNLPATSVEFLRRYRTVEINSSLLEFILPLYEQSKIEEKKDYPVLQVIDYAVPPAKKSWPPRSLFALIGALFSITGYMLYIFIADRIRRSVNPRVILLREEVASIFSRKASR
jgi:uncharacterized protein involved in exopolysaccharide biosynthesis